MLFRLNLRYYKAVFSCFVASNNFLANTQLILQSIWMPRYSQYVFSSFFFFFNTLRSLI